VLTLDTSGLLALLNTADPAHQACVSALRAERPPYYLSVAILAEVAWFLETRFPGVPQRAVLDDIRGGSYTLDWAAGDMDRIVELTERYHDLPLGLADAAVIACAERHRGKVLTTDHRHFLVVARGEASLTVLPAPHDMLR
jgi:predicted nucleic acid-binding protein